MIRRGCVGLAVAALVLGALGVGRPAGAATVIGQEFQHANFGGAVFTVTVAPNGFVCTAGFGNVDASLAPLSNWGWNDIISSYKTYAGCWAKHWDHSNCTGASTAYTFGESRSMGNGMNDRSSCIWWS